MTVYKPIKLQCQTILCTSHNGNGILTSEHALVYIAQMIKFVLLSRWSICMPSLQMDALYQPQAPSPLFGELLGCCSLSTFTYIPSFLLDEHLVYTCRHYSSSSFVIFMGSLLFWLLWGVVLWMFLHASTFCPFITSMQSQCPHSFSWQCIYVCWTLKVVMFRC